MIRQPHLRSEHDARRNLLILAGYPAVGKSTLLRWCIRERVALFGPEHERELFTFRETPILHEWELPPEEILEKNYWFSECHLPFIKRTVDQIKCALLHIDLVSLITDRSNLNLLAPLTITFPRTGVSLAKEEDNKAVISNIFNSHFLGRWDSIAVNTYTLPYAINCQRFNNRKRGIGPFTFLFDGSRQSGLVHYSINKAWKSCVSGWKKAEIYETSEIEQKTVITKING